MTCLTGSYVIISWRWLEEKSISPLLFSVIFRACLKVKTCYPNYRSDYNVFNILVPLVWIPHAVYLLIPWFKKRQFVTYLKAKCRHYQLYMQILWKKKKKDKLPPLGPQAKLSNLSASGVSYHGWPCASNKLGYAEKRIILCWNVYNNDFSSSCLLLRCVFANFEWLMHVSLYLIVC